MTVSLVLGILMLTAFLCVVAVATFLLFYKERKVYLAEQFSTERARRHADCYVVALDRVIKRHKPSRELQAILAATSSVMLSETDANVVLQNIDETNIDILHTNNNLTSLFADIHGICLSDSVMKEDLAELVYHSVKYVSLRWQRDGEDLTQITMTFVRDNLERFLDLIVSIATPQRPPDSRHGMV